MKDEKMFSQRKHALHAQESLPLRLVFHAPDWSAVLAKEVRIKTKMGKYEALWASQGDPSELSYGSSARKRNKNPELFRKKKQFDAQVAALRETTLKNTSPALRRSILARNGQHCM